MQSIEFIKGLCDDCLKEGKKLLETVYNIQSGRVNYINTKYVDLLLFKKWQSNCNVLMKLLDNQSKPWIHIFQPELNNTLNNTNSMIGGLESIFETLNKGYLTEIKELIFSEALSNLNEQANYLYQNNYFLASGVIARAILEEKLRLLCETHNIEIKSKRPTLHDFNSHLYKNNKYAKTEFKYIEFLISIGNKAAHNQQFENSEIKKLIEGVEEIIRKYS